MEETRVFYINTKGNKVTNELVAEILPPENICRSVLCEDGQKRDLWRCTNNELVENFIERMKDFGSVHRLYEIYMSQEPSAKPALWPHDDTAPRPQASRKNRRKPKRLDKWSASLLPVH